jgi:hypothetical protein
MPRLSPTLEDCDIIGRRLIRVVREWRRHHPHRERRFGKATEVAAMVQVIKRATEDYMEFGPSPSAVGFAIATFDQDEAIQEFIRRSLP